MVGDGDAEAVGEADGDGDMVGMVATHFVPSQYGVVPEQPCVSVVDLHVLVIVSHHWPVGHVCAVGTGVADAVGEAVGDCVGVAHMWAVQS